MTYPDRGGFGFLISVRLVTDKTGTGELLCFNCRGGRVQRPLRPEATLQQRSCTAVKNIDLPIVVYSLAVQFWQ